MKILNTTRLASALCVAALTMFHALPSQAGTLVNFPFNEGSGSTTTDTEVGAVGWFGIQNPATDQVVLTDDSPSGAIGDRCITTIGNGFLIVDDSNGPILDITNGPITLETWIKIDPNTVAKSAEGIVGYGDSYKMGLRSGEQVFTLFGIKDIKNPDPVPAGPWTHLAAAWEPGVGVHFYINGNPTFVEYTNVAVANPSKFNYLGIGSEGLANNTVCSLDRVRVHHALLAQGEIDSDAASSKPLLPETLVSYDFNEASFPCQNAIAPARPTMVSSDFFTSEKAAYPEWTQDTPTGLPNDWALSFNTVIEKNFDRINVDSPALALVGGDGNVNFTFETWVKLPSALLNAREVLFQTLGTAPRLTVSIDAKRNLYTTVLGSANYISSVIIPNDDRWHHIAIATTNSASVLFYLDGILRQTIAFNTKAGSADAFQGFHIGEEINTKVYYFRGIMDRLRFSDTALTAGELDFPAIPGQAVVTTQPANTFVDAGGNAQFTAVVSSPSSASYQWFYKANLLSASHTPVPNATLATLSLNNVTANDQGLYFLKITNAIGVSESYAAQLAVRTGPQWDSMGFEGSTYVTGLFNSQDLWTVDVDQNGGTFLVSTASEIETALTSVDITEGDTVHGGTQAVLVTGPGAASTALRPVYGFENQTNVTFEFWVRPLTGGNTTMTTTNTFIIMENTAGKRAAAIRFGKVGTSQNIDYYSGGQWNFTTVPWDGTNWYKCAMQVNYAAKTYNVLINDVKVTANPVAFYDSLSDKFQGIRIYRGAGQAGVILDDMTASVSAPLQISNIKVIEGMVNISWQGGLPPYQIQRRSSLTTGEWENVGSPTSSTAGTDPAGSGPMFYRIKSQ